MRITDVTVVLHERSTSGAASFGPAGRRIPLGVLRSSPAQIADRIDTVAKPTATCTPPPPPACAPTPTGT